MKFLPIGGAIEAMVLVVLCSGIAIADKAGHQVAQDQHTGRYVKRGGTFKVQVMARIEDGLSVDSGRYHWADMLLGSRPSIGKNRKNLLRRAIGMKRRACVSPNS